jgi:hypothetical protein
MWSEEFAPHQLLERLRESHSPVLGLVIFEQRDEDSRGGERDKAVELQCAHMGFAMSGRATRAAVAEIGRFLNEVELPESRH